MHNLANGMSDDGIRERMLAALVLAGGVHSRSSAVEVTSGPLCMTLIQTLQAHGFLDTGLNILKLNDDIRTKCSAYNFVQNQSRSEAAKTIRDIVKSISWDEYQGEVFPHSNGRSVGRAPIDRSIDRLVMCQSIDRSLQPWLVAGFVFLILWWSRRHPRQDSAVRVRTEAAKAR